MPLQLFCDGHFCADCRLKTARRGGSKVGTLEFVTSGHKTPELQCVQLHCLVPAVGSPAVESQTFPFHFSHLPLATIEAV